MFTSCMQKNCNVVVPTSFFMKYLDGNMSEYEIYYAKYQKWNVMQFVDSKDNMKICQPYVCGKVIVRRTDRFNNYQCECGYKHDWKNEGKVVQKSFQKPTKPKSEKKSEKKKKKRS